MIQRLYFERREDGCYDVVCNDLVTTVPPPVGMFPAWVEELIDVGSAIEVLTDCHRDECEYADDMAGVRVGYMPGDTVGVVYREHSVRCGERMLPTMIKWLTAVADAS